MPPPFNACTLRGSLRRPRCGMPISICSTPLAAEPSVEWIPGPGPRGPGGGRGDCAEGYVCVYSYVFTPSGLHDRPALQATAHTDDSVVLRGFGFKPRFRLASSLQPKTKPTTPAKICRDCRKCLFLIISWSAFLWLPSTPQPQNHSKQSKDPERMPDCFRFWRSKVYGDLAL